MKHYSHFYRQEQKAYELSVTDPCEKEIGHSSSSPPKDGGDAILELPPHSPKRWGGRKYIPPTPSDYGGDRSPPNRSIPPKIDLIPPILRHLPPKNFRLRRFPPKICIPPNVKFGDPPQDEGDLSPPTLREMGGYVPPIFENDGGISAIPPSLGGG